MQLTEHELTAASSAVAIFAIVGGYLGVRSANHNAVNIARDERSAKQQDELNALKRDVYAKFYGALMALLETTIEKLHLESGSEQWVAQTRRTSDCMLSAANLMSQIELIAGKRLCNMASSAFGGLVTAESVDDLNKAINRSALFDAMRDDLNFQR